ncbi:hypothetical protein [uncultured Ruminococcus sp.]|uniref:hypothetical protein n=1 Tax=uncultured Ruminococcus sp. TaxID=165186 RepID=UPI0026DB88A0|nr:hypothetical protein [uncultured Ruminococcus sp.]
MADFNCRSAFCVINNPRYDITYKHNEEGEIVKDENGKAVILKQEPTEYHSLTEQQICDDVLNKWVGDDDKRTGAVLFCVSALGLEHLHCVFESEKTFRPLSALKKLFPKVHIEITKGNKKQVEDHINKVGKFEEKGEKIIAKSQVGEIKGCQGKRTDLISPDQIKEFILEGKKPQEIFWEYPQTLKSKCVVETLFYIHRKNTTPICRKVNVHWLFGSTACGKSYSYVELCEKYGVSEVYRVNDYANPFDTYQGEKILFLDEFRGNLPYGTLLGLLDVYQGQVRARYNDKVGLWSDIYITSPYTPFELYQNVSERNDDIDKLEQFIRRIDDIVYCFKYTAFDNSGIFYCKYDVDFDLHSDSEMIREQCSHVKNQVACDGLFTIMNGLSTTFVENKSQS